MKNKKGQIFSLDFAISLILLFLAIGIALNFFELYATKAKEESLKNEIENVGEGSIRLLLSSQEIACRLIKNDANPAAVIDTLSNCIEDISGRLTKARLGITSEFDCSIRIDPVSANLIDQANIENLDPMDPSIRTGCIATDPTMQLQGKTEVFSATRKIVVNTGNENVTKEELENCIQGTGACDLFDANLTFVVWRA